MQLTLKSIVRFRRAFASRTQSTGSQKAGRRHTTQNTSHCVEDGARLFGHALTLAPEGVVAKRAGSVYLSGERLPDWMKIKQLGAVPPKRFKR